MCQAVIFGLAEIFIRIRAVPLTNNGSFETSLPGNKTDVVSLCEEAPKSQAVYPSPSGLESRAFGQAACSENPCRYGRTSSGYLRMFLDSLIAEPWAMLCE